MKHLYTTTAIATGGGREGLVQTNDGILKLELAFPKEVGGPGGKTNPEQLFAAGYAACFNSALRTAAKNRSVSIKDETVNCEVSIYIRDDGGFQLGATIRVSLPGLDYSLAQELVNESHRICPYSHAIRNSIDVKVSLE